MIRSPTPLPSPSPSPLRTPLRGGGGRPPPPGVARAALWAAAAFALGVAAAQLGGIGGGGLGGPSPYRPDPAACVAPELAADFAAAVRASRFRGRRPRREAYATFVGHDQAYALGALALGASLAAAGARGDRVLMHPPGALSPAAAAALAPLWALREVPEVLNPMADAAWRAAHAPELDAAWRARRWAPSRAQAAMYSKLNVWGLEGYDVVAYLDADTLALRSPDELFDAFAPPLAAAPDPLPPDTFNAGVLVVRPSAPILALMLREAARTASVTGDDQGLHNAVFSRWFAAHAAHRLPAAFNAMTKLRKVPAAWARLAAAPGGGIAVVHYTPGKPWADPAGRDKLAGPLHAAWWDAFAAYYAGAGVEQQAAIRALWAAAMPANWTMGPDGRVALPGAGAAAAA